MSSSEIAKLETRWRENPQGLTFAPLAEAYRKLREPARALEVLAEGLSRHPDYIPASIVLGRCHLDLEQHSEAESAFRRVLELDDENAIALRALADLAERDGRLAEAAGRLQELLAVDRSNDEARAQLARIDEAIASAPIVAPRGGSDVAEDPAAYDWTPEPPEPETVAGLEGLETTPADEADTPAVPADGSDLMLEDNLLPPVDVEPLPDLVVEDVPPISSETAEAPPLGDLVGKDFRRLGAEVKPLPDLATGSDSMRPADSFAADEPADAFAASEPVELERELEQELGPELESELERASEIELRPAERSEFQIESATDDWITARADEDGGGGSDSRAFDPSYRDMLGDSAEPEFSVGPEASADVPPAPEAGAPDPAEEPMPVEAYELVDEPAAADAADVSDPDLVVTETMAELYLRQGHRSEALRVYRELWLRNRDDLRLRERVDALETELAAEESGAGSEDVPYPAPVAAQSVAAFLGAILAARPAGGPPAWRGDSPGSAQPLSRQEQSESPDAAPTRPAADHLSLSAIFGETGSPVPPAVAAGAPADEDGISFDAFFGGDAAAAPARARAASRDDDDLDQFHAWLQNLKR